MDRQEMEQGIQRTELANAVELIPDVAPAGAKQPVATWEEFAEREAKRLSELIEA